MTRQWQDHKGNRHERGYGKAWDALRRVILERDSHLCVLCKARGILTNAHAVDHITPKSQGGTDDTSNLQAICKQCHAVKTATEKNGKTYVENGCDANGIPTNSAHHWHKG